MKTPRDLEYRTLQFLESLKTGAQVSAETKPALCLPTWPQPAQAAARQLAAFANTARGRDLWWLVGVRDGKVIGAEATGLDDWMAGATPLFDGLAPRVRAYQVPTGELSGKAPLSVVAVQIETQRAPFVIRRGRAGGPITNEVLWHDAATEKIRPANRLELIQLLAPLQELPRCDVLEAELTFYRNPHATPGSKTAYRWTLDGSIYISPSSDARVVVPLHRCRGGIVSLDGRFTAEASDVNLSADKSSPAVRITDSAALIEGLGRVFFYCCGAVPEPALDWQAPLAMTFDLNPAGADRAAVGSAELARAATMESNQAGRWKL